jgi:hypothetical protein
MFIDVVAPDETGIVLPENSSSETAVDAKL